MLKIKFLKICLYIFFVRMNFIPKAHFKTKFSESSWQSSTLIHCKKIKDWLQLIDSTKHDNYKRLTSKKKPVDLKLLYHFNRNPANLDSQIEQVDILK